MTVLDNIRVSQHYHLGYGVAGCFFRTPNYMRREKTIEKQAMEVLEALELRQFAGELPKNLPYGMQRRVEIARALSLRPKLLLLTSPPRASILPT